MKKRWLWYALIAIGVLLIVAAIFGAGLVAGRWGTLRQNQGGLLPSGLLGGGHGAAGIVEQVSEKSIVVRERNGVTQTILIDNRTRFEKSGKPTTLNDLGIGDRVLVVGAPDPQRQIRARLIRIVIDRAPNPVPAK